MSAVRVGSLCYTGGCLFFLMLCSRGFQDLLRLNPPSLLMLFGCISIYNLRNKQGWIICFHNTEGELKLSILLQHIRQEIRNNLYRFHSSLLENEGV